MVSHGFSVSVVYMFSFQNSSTRMSFMTAFKDPAANHVFAFTKFFKRSQLYFFLPFAYLAGFAGNYYQF
jgi:hypothetical protein